MKIFIFGFGQVSKELAKKLSNNKKINSGVSVAVRKETQILFSPHNNPINNITTKIPINISV